MPQRESRTPADPIRALGERLLQMPQQHLAGWIEGLAPADVVLVERAVAEVAAAGWRASPLSFGVHFGLLDPMPHTALLSQKFLDAVEGRDPRQIWNLPARHGKSLIASGIGPAWALERDPTFPIALTSYGDELANENATFVRDLLVAHGDELEVRLRRDRRRMDRFVTDQGGGLIAAGVGSGLTGFGAGGIICDDPLKNWQEAHSEARRLHVWNWFRSVVRLRLQQTARMRDLEVEPWIIVVMTRWHEEDLSGKLLSEASEADGEPYTLVRLPAIAEAPNPTAADPNLRQPDLLGRAPGEPLAPQLFDLDALVKRARSLGSYLTAGMEQQRPSPEEGTDIMRAWWKWYTQAPRRFDASCSSWDMKLKDKESGDYVVGQVWGRTGSDYWGIDQLRGQYNFVTTKTAIVLMAVRHPWVKVHLIENTGNGPEVIASLRQPQKDYSIGEDVRSELGITDDEVPLVNALFRRGMTGLIAINPKGDKRARARAQTPAVEAGNVHLPLAGTWPAVFVEEASTFPNGAHDDQVDSWSQAMKRLSTSGGKVNKKPERKVGKPKPSSRAVAGKVGRPTARAGRPGQTGVRPRFLR